MFAFYSLGSGKWSDLRLPSTTHNRGFQDGE
jgi:hypothetical protein